MYHRVFSCCSTFLSTHWRITMRAFLLAMGALVLGKVCIALAANQPGQPKMVPLPPRESATSRLEEEVEVLEAQRDIKKAYVKAAEIGVKAAHVGLDKISRIVASGAVGKEDADRAKLEVEMAEAQLEIRVAEMKEVEVKIKHTKKRLDEAKAPPPGFRPPGGQNSPPKPPEPPKTNTKDPGD
jgi:hypothetical protein